MKAIALNGSPRKDGNTHTLLQHVLTPLKEADWRTEIIQIGGTIIKGCKACGACKDNRDKKCIQDDDMVNSLLDKIYAADALIIGSPTYFAGVTPETKAVIDRIGYVSLANGGLLAGKIGAAVTAVRRGGEIHTFDTINHLFLISRMIVPGSTYWNLGIGRNKGEVHDDKEVLANMNHLGRAIVWLGDVIQKPETPFPEK